MKLVIFYDSDELLAWFHQPSTILIILIDSSHKNKTRNSHNCFEVNQNKRKKESGPEDANFASWVKPSVSMRFKIRR